MTTPKLEKLLVCVGAQKAGTSWLHSVLSEDNRLAKCPFVKEIHYFDYIYNNLNHINSWRASNIVKLCKSQDVITTFMFEAWFSGKRESTFIDFCIQHDISPMLARRFTLLMGDLNDEWYTELLSLRKNQLCSIDITPDYAVIGSEGFSHMANIANETYLLFILRNPVERAWSGLLQGKKRTPGGVEGFFDKYGNNIDLLFERCTEQLDVKKRNNYLKSLQDIHEAGLKDKLLIKFYDDIKEDPAKLIGDIYAFIDVPAPDMEIFSNTLGARVYETKKAPMPEELELRLKAHFKEMVATINGKFINVPNAWLEYFEL
ncbi:hypothetical protein JCM14076_11410 [Methylosoma difficile]